jgi:hypothetical protein
MAYVKAVPGMKLESMHRYESAGAYYHWHAVKAQCQLCFGDLWISSVHRSRTDQCSVQRRPPCPIPTHVFEPLFFQRIDPPTADVSR